MLCFHCEFNVRVTASHVLEKGINISLIFKNKEGVVNIPPVSRWKGTCKFMQSLIKPQKRTYSGSSLI